ncbi:hypothetical protein HIM_07319 [Hirsutella minnesotensis 3608]|uniref:Uncharacterized protein n=1 Tax=Hirsutella minnesotensis 3608 TaxID=1043627 RepID=A0A0F7ZN86_9HYPO|nr:hypothetical protein HIM_07319 [Hirsutella minnesotensis 3608]
MPRAAADETVPVAAATPAPRVLLGARFLANRAPQTTAPAAAADPLPATSSARSGTDCFTTSMVDTSACSFATKDGKLSTVSCFPTQATSSECSPGLMCTTDTSNNDVCMVRRDSLDTGGIIIAVIFGALVGIGIGVLTFLCCRDRREQKRLAAKAEAVALARAHTRKQKANDAHVPLMRQQEGAPGSPNPFQQASGQP